MLPDLIHFAEFGKLPEYHVKATDRLEANLNLRRPKIAEGSWSRSREYDR